MNEIVVAYRHTLRGNLDHVSRRAVAGWAQDITRPEEPVSLMITDNDRLLRRLLANQHREDLTEFGSGRHSFEVAFTPPLSSFAQHIVRVRREADGMDIPGSPVTIEPSSTLGEDEKELVAGLLGELDHEEEVTQAIDFLAFESAKLKQRLADLQSKRAEREEMRRSLARWRKQLPEAENPAAPDAAPSPPRGAPWSSTTGCRNRPWTADRAPFWRTCNRSVGSATRSHSSRPTSWRCTARKPLH